MLFNFMDAFNYEERKVDRYTDGPLTVSTVYASDGFKPYETAIEHPDYNDGDWVIVEAYENRGAAQDGHNRWVKVMTIEPLPAQIRDCANEFFSAMVVENDPDSLTFKRGE